MSVKTIQQGNEIGGSFSINFQNYSKENIPSNVTAIELKNILLTLPNVVSTYVHRNNPTNNCNDGLCYDGPTPSGGLKWSVYVTTNSTYGDTTPVFPVQVHCYFYFIFVFILFYFVLFCFILFYFLYFYCFVPLFVRTLYLFFSVLTSCHNSLLFYFSFIFLLCIHYNILNIIILLVFLFLFLFLFLYFLFFDLLPTLIFLFYFYSILC